MVMNSGSAGQKGRFPVKVLFLSILPVLVVIAGLLCCGKRDSGSSQVSGPAQAPSLAHVSGQDQATGPVSQVIVNEVTVPQGTVQALEQQYRMRIKNGDYWYDRISGAWGYHGGPCMGQIRPFLELGGPLKPSASNGNTGIFINGRELHYLDVRGLQQITVVIPGRYRCDARGNIGFEGGPPLANLGALANAARSRGVRRQGILSTYDKTGATVIGGDVLMK
jgi:hypothetical protein